MLPRQVTKLVFHRSFTMTICFSILKVMVIVSRSH